MASINGKGKFKQGSSENAAEKLKKVSIDRLKSFDFRRVLPSFGHSG